MDAAVEQRNKDVPSAQQRIFVTFDPSKVRHYLRENIKFKPTFVVVTIYE